MIAPRPLLRAYWGLHELLDRLSGGRLTTARPTASRLGVLFLTTTGHRTGQPRRNGLYFVEDGPAYVVAASNAGARVDPAWWRNLQANPEAVVHCGAARHGFGRALPRRRSRLDCGRSSYAAIARSGSTSSQPCVRSPS